MDADSTASDMTSATADRPRPRRVQKPVFSIVDLDVRDARAFDEYVEGHQPSVEHYGGKFLVATSRLDLVEGCWLPRKLVTHQWPSADAFYAWYDSIEYRPWKSLRLKAAVANVVLAEGL